KTHNGDTRIAGPPGSGDRIQERRTAFETDCRDGAHRHKIGDDKNDQRSQNNGQPGRTIEHPLRPQNCAATNARSALARDQRASFMQLPAVMAGDVIARHAQETSASSSESFFSFGSESLKVSVTSSLSSIST